MSSRRSILIGLLLVLFLLTAWTAQHSATMTGWELTVFRYFYDASDKMWLFALGVTQLGSAWALLALVGVLFVARWRPEPALVVLRAGFFAYVLSIVAKYIVGRPRPALLLDTVVTREVIVRGHGFPSTHVALATAISLALLPYLPKKLRWLPIVWIGLVAWSRLYLGVHTPLDVLGGFLLGALVALAAAYSNPSARRVNPGR